MRDEEVQIAVIVGIHPAGAGFKGMTAHDDARPGRHVGKRPVAVVVIENVVAEIRDVEVSESVVIIVAGGHALRISFYSAPGKACSFGHIGECAVTVILVEAIE